MAKPDTADGYIQIATELWEALGKYRLSGEETKVLNVIIRKTYGYKKKEDHIALSQLQEMTGNMKKPSVIRALKKLIDKKVVSKSANGALSVNKDYESWEPLAKKLTPVSKKANDVSNMATKSLAKQLPTIEKKENYTKEITTNVVRLRSPEIDEVSFYFLQVMQIPKEDCPVRVSRRYWSNLLTESKRGVEGVKWLIDVAGRDEFYRNNITSSKDLYYKRMKLIARARGNAPRISVMKGGQDEKLAADNRNESLLPN